MNHYLNQVFLSTKFGNNIYYCCKIKDLEEGKEKRINVNAHGKIEF